MSGSGTDSPGRLVAERAIWETFYAYFWLIDSGQWQRVARECFAPDAVVRFGGPAGEDRTLGGRNDIDGYYRDIYGSVGRLEQMAHVAGQTHIAWPVDGPPTLRALVTGWRWGRTTGRPIAPVPDRRVRPGPPGQARPADHAVVVMAVDEYVQYGGAWLISSRRVTYHGTAVHRPTVAAARGKDMSR